MSTICDVATEEAKSEQYHQNCRSNSGTSALVIDLNEWQSGRSIQNGLYTGNGGHEGACKRPSGEQPDSDWV